MKKPELRLVGVLPDLNYELPGLERGPGFTFKSYVKPGPCRDRRVPRPVLLHAGRATSLELRLDVPSVPLPPEDSVIRYGE